MARPHAFSCWSAGTVALLAVIGAVIMNRSVPGGFVVMRVGLLTAASTAYAARRAIRGLVLGATVGAFLVIRARRSRRVFSR